MWLVQTSQFTAGEHTLTSMLQRASYRIKALEFSSEEEVRIILEPSSITDHGSEPARLARTFSKIWLMIPELITHYFSQRYAFEQPVGNCFPTMNWISPQRT